MSSRLRKFTNGYHTAYSDDSDDFENVKEDMKNNVVERAENIKTKWAKAKNLMKDENKDSKFLNSFIKDVKEEIDYLMEWMKENDEKIEEVKIYRVGRWSRKQKKIKLAQYKDVMEDIEVHGKTLKLLLSICKVIGEDDLISDDDHAVNSVEYLETVWHSVWLRTLEWECLIEQSLTNQEDINEDTDAEEDILKTVVDGVKESKHVTDENICDSDGLSSDSGFSDHSGEYDTHILTECHSEEVTDTPIIHHKGEGEGDKRKTRQKKSRSLRKEKYWSWNKILKLIIFLTFILSISLITFHIRCFENTCAIYIPSYIRYYNYNHVRHVI